MKELLPICDRMKKLNILPEDWINTVQQIVDNKKCVLQNLDTKSKGFLVVEQLLKSTIPEGVVKKVEIIQNLYLWEVYQQEVAHIRDNLGMQPET